MNPSTLSEVSVGGGSSVESADQDRCENERTVAAEKVEVAIALAKRREAERRRAEAEVRTKRFLRELGYGV